MLDLNSMDFRRNYWIVADVTYVKRTESSSAPGDNVEDQGNAVWFGNTPSSNTPRIFVHLQDPTTTTTKRFHFLHLVKEVIDVDDGVAICIKTSSQLMAENKSSEITIQIEPNKYTDRARLKEMVFAFRHAEELKGMKDKFATADNPPGDLLKVLEKANAARKRKEKTEIKSETHLPEPSADAKAKNPVDVKRLGSKRGASMVQFANTTDSTERKKLRQDWSGAYRPSPVKKADKAWSVMRKAQGRDTFDDDFKPTPSARDQEQRQQTTISRFFGRPANREGFKNLGNSCYMGAVISVLVALKPFVTDMEKFRELLCTSQNDRFVNEGGWLDLFMALAGVCRRANLKGHGVLDLTHVKKAIGARARRFAGREQQDAHEFYAGCMDVLGMELRRVATQAHTDAKPLPDLVHKVSDDNFSLRIKDTLVCMSKACAYTRSRSELCRDLSLSVPEPKPVGAGAAHAAVVPLTELVESFFADNHLECKCEKCGSDAALATHKIKALPRHLVIHLKRFRPDWERKIYLKLQTRVEIPLRLDLARHCGGSTRPPAATDDAHMMRMAASPHTGGGSGSAGSSSSSRATSALQTPRLGSRPGSAKTVDTAAVKMQRTAGASPPPESVPEKGKSESAVRSTPPPKDSQRDAIVVDDNDECGVPRKLDFDSNASTSRLSREERDMQRAIELSAREAGQSSTPGDAGSAGAFDHRQFSLGDEDEDLRKALELSQAAGFEVVEDVEVIGDGEGDVVMGSSPETEEDLAMMMPAQESSESDSDSESDGCAEAPNAEYVLHGVVSHLGHTATSGHYVSDVWDTETDQWRHFDDDLVTPQPRDAVLKSRADWQRGSYLLVYTHSSCFKKKATPARP